MPSPGSATYPKNGPALGPVGAGSPSSRTFSGPRAVFMLSGVPIGYANGVSGEEVIDHEPVDVLSLLEVAEHVAVAYRCSLSANMFRIVAESLQRASIMPRLEDILFTGEIDASIMDIVTGDVLYLFQGVRCGGASFDVSARGLVQQNVTFVAIRVLDESQNP